MDIPPGYTRSRRLGKIQRFLYTWRNGRKDHYPMCCVLRFSIYDAWEDGKLRAINDGQAIKRGLIYRGPVKDNDPFVPCGVFHHKTHNWED